MMLEYEDYLDAISNMIRMEMVSAEYAAADVKDISNRLIQNLNGQSENDFNFSEPAIIVAEDLTPSETVQMQESVEN